jgi:hypothetical protein
MCYMIVLPKLYSPVVFELVVMQPWLCLVHHGSIKVLQYRSSIPVLSAALLSLGVVTSVTLVASVTKTHNISV